MGEMVYQSEVRRVTMYEKILIALEGKATDETVLIYVQALAAQTGAEVTLLRVITVANDEAGGLGLQFQLEIGSSGWRRRKQAEAYMPELERRLREEGLCVKSALVISTRPEADTIISYAAENRFDLIVMANDSRPWYKRWIGGSPADGVLRKTTVPALFIADGTQTAPARHSAPEANAMMAVFGSASL
jgi:nucleotide-binding universal stress UspA family protein